MKANPQSLKDIVTQLLANHKGLLAMDESIPTCNKRFKELGIPETEEYRRKYRELIATTAGLEESISGAILFDETLQQRSNDGILLIEILKNKGIIPGIKVDAGTIPLAGFPGEKITEGLDGLPERLTNYYEQGAHFAKWRAVFTIGHDLPTERGIKANAHLLARYAALCQAAGLVPIVEPEVLMDGNHSLKRCAEVTNEVLHAVFNALYQFKVDLEGMILKPNMILPGEDCADQSNAHEIAHATISCFLKCVPAAVPGIAFLSGGQPAILATERLNRMHQLFGEVMPWALTFSFSRAIQQPALEIWKGNDQNIAAAQKALAYRAACNHAANLGQYTPETE